MDLPKLSPNTLATAKICRLCETKDGPFLNIFGPDMNIAKKIENVVFITINEYDDLPHKICFRCSARLEDFQEFVNKCVRSQQNLSKLVGKKFSQKNIETRKIKYSWEAKLNENKMSNDEYCDELIKKALEMATDFKSKTREFDIKMMKQHNIKDCEIRLRHVDRPDFPGIQKKSEKYHVTDLKRIPKIIPVHKKSKLNTRSTTIMTKSSSDLKNSSLNAKTNMTKIASGSKIVLDNTNGQSIDTNRSKCTENSIPDNFTTVRVAGVGVVYTCKKCDSVVIDVKKVQTHKCFNLKNSNKSSPPITNTIQPSVENKKSVVHVSRPGPARYKQKAELKCSEVIDLDPPQQKSHHNNLQLFNQNSEAFSNVRLTNIQSLNPEQRNQPNNFYGYPMPTNFYLVPSGDNTFSLRAGPPISATEPSFPKPIIQQYAVPTPAHVAPSNLPENIIPDIVRKVESGAVNQRNGGSSEHKSKKTKKNNKQIEESPVYTQQAQPSAPKILKPKKKTEKPVPAPYPIGLLCRNSASVSGDNIQTQLNASLLKSSKNSEYPHYTILPPKTPGKLVLSTIPSKKAQNSEAEKQSQESVPLKKRRKQSFEIIKEAAEPAPPVNQHFFTYINLDNMLAPSSVLPTKTLQESSVSTTVTPSPPAPPARFARKTKAIVNETPPKQIQEEITEYVCSICDLIFSREKKLVAHVKTHYQTYEDD